MKTKREAMTARFTKECDNAKNMNRDKEVTDRFLLIDKKTERTVVDCRIYMGRSSSASTVHASVWVTLKETKKPATWQYAHTAGHGSAGGYGYHKLSAAVQEALTSAGVELYGSPYNQKNDDGHDPKKRVHVDGCGDRAAEDALLAVAHAAGWTDVIFVKA